ncbi:YfhO family protein [Streptomyces sp. NPDC091272]|uniref:YfhO family protein n=1 Tax=Streptomyces sp. NPDC091272 TaxID=3365981 RepID=UPI0037F9ED4D
MLNRTGRSPRPYPAAHPVAASSLLAALLAALTHCLGSALAGSQPFGRMNRNVNDLGTQFVPFHAHLWDVLHGRADGGWLINWQSGYGSSFLPDVGTYLSSPFALLVAVFPKEQIDLAVYVTSVARIGAAGAVMAWLLLTLRPGGRWWAAGTLGAAYALCGWAVIEASYNPMWLDGLIGFPLLCLVGEWVRTGRRFRLWFGAGVVLVALVWTANFYTAYMATAGAGLVLGVRLLTERTTGPAGPKGAGAEPGPGPKPRQGSVPAPGPGSESERSARGVPPVRVLLRACAVVALGIGLSAPVLFTVFAGTRHAYPGMGLSFRQAGWGDVLGRLLPATYNFNAPAMYVSSVVLVLACALPFHRGIAVRVRVGWPVLAVAVLVSMQWGPTHLAWHAFAEPNGSSYRQTFVLSGVLVIAGWLAISHLRLPRPALAGGVACVALLALAGLGSAFTGRWAWLGAGAGLVAVACALVLLGGRRRGYAVAAAVLLVGCTVAQSALTTAWAAKRRVAAQDDHAPYGARQVAQSAVIAGVDEWPLSRTEPGRAQTVHNDSMLVGGQGAAYYSSMTSAVLTRTLGALGDGWNGSGRAPHSLDNPVTDAVFGVGTRLRSTYRQGADTDFTVVRRESAPLVTVRELPAGAAHYGHSAFANQELLLGAKVYERLPGSAGPAGSPGPAGTCTPGAPVFVWAPGFNGTVRMAGTDAPGVRFEAKRGRVRAAMQQTGVAPADGRVRIELHGSGARGAEAACLREDRLTSAVRDLRAAGASEIQVGDGTIRAVVGGTGTAGTGTAGSGAVGSGAAGSGTARSGTGASGAVRSGTGASGTPGAGAAGAGAAASGTTGSGTAASGAAGSAAAVVRTAVFAVPRIAGWQCAVDGGPLSPAGNHLGLLAVPLGEHGREARCVFRPPGLRAGVATGLGSAVLVVAVLVVRWFGRRDAWRRSGPVVTGRAAPRTPTPPPPSGSAVTAGR